MTVLMHDVHEHVHPNYKRSSLSHFRHTNLLYADDTLIIGKCEAQIEKLLQQVEIESAKYNLKLSKGKCKIVKGGRGC